MTMAVLDLDVLDLPDDVGPDLDRHEGALALLRIGGRPCGQAVLARADWQGDRPLRDVLMAAADSAFWEAWLAHAMDLPVDVPAESDLPATDVVICTRDRADDLRKCLSDLMAMPDEGQRIIVVDNASATDETRIVTESFPGVRYVREDRPGLDVARNTGLRATDAEVVAFIDDDAAPDRLWLRKLRRNFADPSVLAAAGLTMAMELDSDAQIAFQRLGGFGRGFRRAIYDSSNCYAFHAWVAGAGVNMALRRKAIDVVGLFDEALDAGTKSLAGGDSDYFRRIINAGWRIAYDPEALNWHRHRRSMEELQHQIYGYEVSAFAMITKALFYEKDARGIGAVLRWMRMRAGQLRELVGLAAPGLPFSPLMTQLHGAAAGPGRYRAAVRERANAR